MERDEGGGCRNMSVYAFSRRSFCCKRKKKTVSVTGKRAGRAADEGMNAES